MRWTFFCSVRMNFFSGRTLFFCALKGQNQPLLIKKRHQCEEENWFLPFLYALIKSFIFDLISWYDMITFNPTCNHQKYCAQMAGIRVHYTIGGLHHYFVNIRRFSFKNNLLRNNCWTSRIFRQKHARKNTDGNIT